MSTYAVAAIAAIAAGKVTWATITAIATSDAVSEEGGIDKTPSAPRKDCSAKAVGAFFSGRTISA
jgi:hypothetical protein